MRVHLKGVGTPIPTLALPDPNLDENLPIQTFQFTEDDSFSKADYVGLGYTHYEAFCVGAAGGRGGRFVQDPDGMGWYYTYGGGGGGGGMHTLLGLLADLPDSVPIIVGQVGDAGADGVHKWYYFDGVLNETAPYSPAQPGNDGGYSSFGDVCQASGGKGGAGVVKDYDVPPTSYPSEHNPGGGYDGPDPGIGGEGGLGGRTLAGGGAVGGNSISNKTGAQGVWDGVVGQGGGGGFGGQKHTSPSSPMLNTTTSIEKAGSGGRGSFSYVDTQKYGERQSTSSEVPGSGGGARPTPLLKFGSHATGYSPNGVVYLRLMAIES